MLTNKWEDRAIDGCLDRACGLGQENGEDPDKMFVLFKIFWYRTQKLTFYISALLNN